MRRVIVILAMISECLLFISLCFAGQTSRSNSAALKGLKTIFVLVEDLPQKAAEIGLTAERMKTETETKLREKGISVPNYSYENPYLDISVNVVNMAFSVEVSLRDSVVLKRDKSIHCRAATWLNSVTGVHSNDPNYIVAGLQALLDSFLNDYYQANPENKR
jgi:hypothetical protein